MNIPQDILNGKILIVDDMSSNILLLERMLAAAGYTALMSTTFPPTSAPCMPNTDMT